MAHNKLIDILCLSVFLSFIKVILGNLNLSQQVPWRHLLQEEWFDLTQGLLILDSDQTHKEYNCVITDTGTLVNLGKDFWTATDSRQDRRLAEVDGVFTFTNEECTLFSQSHSL